MRKSKMRSAQGHLGGVEEGVGIIPPAAKAFDVAARPENDPILRQVLSPEELAQVSHYRMLDQSKRSRKYSQGQQAENDKVRELALEARRRQDRNVASASPNGRRKRGQAFSLGRTSPLTEQEEAHLSGESVVSGELNLKEDLTAEQQEEFREKWNENVENVKKSIELAGEKEVLEAVASLEEESPEEESGIVEEDEVPVPVPPANSAPVQEEGGTPFFANSLGTNLNPQEPQGRKGSRRKSNK